MRRLLLALVLIPLTAPVYAERNCTDHFAEDAPWDWDDCTATFTFTFPNAVYEGDFSNGTRNGRGTFTYSNGNVYEGDFKDGDVHGKGTLTYTNGGVYEGYFEDGNYHGKGTLTYPNGDIKEGDWKEGASPGKGTYTWADGNVYEGDFKDGNFHGKGKLTRADGTLFRAGIWVDGDYSEDWTNFQKAEDFHEGNGVLQNYESAKQFYVLVVEGEIDDLRNQAMVRLAGLYADGKVTDAPGVADTIAGWFDDGESKRHLIKGHMWLTLAGKEMIQTIENGFSLAEIKQARGLKAGLIQTIENQLSPEEIKQAQDLAKACLENDYQGC